MNQILGLIREFMQLRSKLHDTPEDKSDELITDLRKIETRIATAIDEHEKSERTKSEDRMKNVGAELDKFDLGKVVNCAIQARSVDGLEREIQTEFDLNESQVPIECLINTRADAVTPIPATNTTLNQNEILGEIYPQTAREYLNVQTPTVPAGTAAYPILTKGATVYTPAKAASVQKDALEFTIQTVKPSRIQAGLFYNIEDAAQFRGMNEALRRDLSEAINDKLDQLIITNMIANGTDVDKTGTAPPIFGTFSDVLHSRVDGKFAQSTMDIRTLFGTNTYEKLASTFVTNTDLTALSQLRTQSGGVRVSAHIPAVASKKQKSLYVAPGISTIAPVWQGITLIPDNITKAAEGQFVLNAVMLYGIQVIRAGRIGVVEYQLSA